MIFDVAVTPATTNVLAKKFLRWVERDPASAKRIFGRRLPYIHREAERDAVFDDAWPQLMVLAYRGLPILVIFLAYIYGERWSPRTASSDYFLAAAGVIPVLVLGLAIETRVFSLRRLTAGYEPVRPVPVYVYEALDGSGHHTRAKILRGVEYFWIRVSAAYMRSSVAAVTALTLGLLSYSEWHCMAILAGIGRKSANPQVVSAGILAGLVGVSLAALIGGADDL